MYSDSDKLADLFVKINGLLVDEKRNVEDVMRYIQRVIDDPDFVQVIDRVVSVPSDRIVSVSNDAPQPVVAKPIQTDEKLVDWQNFYQEVFGLMLDFSDVELSAEQPGFGWVVVVPQGMTLNQAWDKCKERFPTFSYIGDNLDKAVPTNDRTPTNSYAKRFRDRVEADEENKSLSANDLAKRKVQSITLLERILLELWHHWKTGEHLDLDNWTLCAGSRGSDDTVPSTCWRDVGFLVCLFILDLALDNLRSRSAV